MWMGMVGLLILVGLMSLGGLLERKSWAPIAEVLRVVATGAFLVVLARDWDVFTPISLGAAAFVAVSLPLFFVLEKMPAPVNQV